MGGHAGGPPIAGPATAGALADAVEEAMDAAGFATAHFAGNSLGGFLSLLLAARGRARSVVALAPAGGWAAGDESYKQVFDLQASIHEQAKKLAPHAERILASNAGRRQATQLITVNYDHIPVEFLVHQLNGIACCHEAPRLIEQGFRSEWDLDAERIACPVRIVWGTCDRLLPWPSAATRFRDEWLPHADWIELEDIGHCPQLDVPLETAELILGFTAGR